MTETLTPTVTATADGGIVLDLNGHYVCVVAAAHKWALHAAVGALLPGDRDVPVTVPMRWTAYGRDESGTVTYTPTGDGGCDLAFSLDAHGDLGYRTARLTRSQRWAVAWDLMLAI